MTTIKIMKVRGKEIPEGDQSTGVSPSLFNNEIRMCVCLSVCLFVCYELSPKRKMIRTCGFLQMVEKLSGMVFIYISNVSGHWFGHYCPKTGHQSKKWPKNGCFLKVFRIIEGVMVMIRTLNFNTM